MMLLELPFTQKGLSELSHLDVDHRLIIPGFNINSDMLSSHLQIDKDVQTLFSRFFFDSGKTSLILHPTQRFLGWIVVTESLGTYVLARKKKRW